MSQASDGAIVVPKKELLRGALIAAGVAGILLVTMVLPAEYGIDATGAGKAMGLTALYRAAPATGSATGIPDMPGASKGSTVSAKGETRQMTIASPQEAAYRADVMEIVLPPNKGLEVKTHLAKGATLIYSWKTKNGGLVNHDFHGEPINAGKDEFESFILGKGINQSRGALIAPFTGVHGWYWKNLSAEPVTIVLEASGFYSDIFRK
jgi:hypothetical protein